MSFQLEANCGTTAMGIMPHTDVDRALALAMGLDIPFWPQLPKVSFCEDMYVQASEQFPGIVLDTENETTCFSSGRFIEEMNAYTEKIADPDALALGEDYSVVYHRFLARDLSGYRAIRGQLTGPVSLGFKIMDEDNKPIIYDDNVRDLMYDFIQRKVHVQYRELKEKNAGAFVWLDEPGLGWVFSGLAGYNDVQAGRDYREFMAGFEGPRALHLCANVNLPYLLGMGIDLLSFDAYQIELMPKGYAIAVADFIRDAGIIAWGIVPTESSALATETPDTLAARLIDYWQVVAANSDVSAAHLAAQALIAPARCCLKNYEDREEKKKTEGEEVCRVLSSEEEVVETAFGYLGKISARLRHHFKLD